MTAVSPDSSFNTAVSFVSNTNWQGYAGETTMSYLTQMLGLTVQNFLSAATGIAVAFALARGFAARGSEGRGFVGNFWVDLTRITLWLLVPLSFVLAIFFAGQGVIQNFDAYKTVETVEATVYQNPKLDELIMEGRGSFDEAKRTQVYKRVQEFLADESPEVDLYVTKVYALSNDRLKGVEMTVEKPFNYWKLHY